MNLHMKKHLKNLLLYQRWTLASYEEVLKAEHDFYVNYLRPGMVVFDVGANVGELTSLFAQCVGKEGHVHSFEATRTTYEKLASTYANMQQVTVNHLAVADQVGYLPFHIYDEAHAEWNTLANRPLDVKPVRIDQVPAMTIDTYCQEQQISKIDLLKIDVEGAEYQVLLGAQAMLKAHRIHKCIFESGTTTLDMGNHPREIVRYLKELGYNIHNVIRRDPIFPGGENRSAAVFSMHVITLEAQ